jgi:hypothetical protein
MKKKSFKVGEHGRDSKVVLLKYYFVLLSGTVIVAATRMGLRKKNHKVFLRSRQQRALVSLPANPPGSQSERGYRVNRTNRTRACKAHTLNH